MEEVWKDVDGFEGIYQVSNLGNVKSLNYRGTKNSKNLVPKINSRGYSWVILYKGSIHKCVLVHRLVGNAFIDNPDNLPLINHKDEDPQNNKVDNLEWCTQSYNVRYSICIHPDRRISRYKKTSGEVSPYKHTSQVIQLSKDGEQIQIWDSISKIVNQTNWRGSSIVDVCRGKRKSAYGYVWHFAS